MMYGNEDYMLMQRDPNRLVKLIVAVCLRYCWQSLWDLTLIICNF